MSKICLVCALCILLPLSVFGQPRQWSDDFTAVATYDSNSLNAPCANPAAPSTKYSFIEALLGDIYSQRAVSGGGRLVFTNRSRNILAYGRLELAIIGVLDVGQDCPDNPDPSGGASFITSEPFTSDNVCAYGGVLFTQWQFHFPVASHNLRGPDGGCGVASVDDDLDGTVDEDDECLAARPTSVSNGFGNANGTGFRGGVDAAPGVAGVDDDANGIVDDLDEMGWPGSDDGDDTTRSTVWMLLDASAATSSLICVEMDPGNASEVFNMREIISGVDNKLESPNEVVQGYYLPNEKYNWVFCVSGTCYGSVIWHALDMANPDETLGPLTNTNHTAPDDSGCGFLFYQGNSPNQYIRRQHVLGNGNLSDTYWVVSGNPAQYYPSPSADLDADKDVDGFDFLTFSNCYNGSNKSPLAACTNSQADLDKDGDVDGFDFLTFSNCYNGSNRKPLAVCFPPDVTACGS